MKTGRVICKGYKDLHIGCHSQSQRKIERFRYVDAAAINFRVSSRCISVIVACGVDQFQFSRVVQGFSSEQ